MFLIYK